MQDPLAPVYVKLFACFIHRPSLPSSYAININGHLVTKLEITGIIVELRHYSEKSVMLVDDSTGQLTCNCWPGISIAHSSHDDLTGLPFLQRHLQLGRLITILGNYSPKLELNAHCIKLEEDEHIEMLHWLECIYLYENVYSKPPDLSPPPETIGDHPTLLSAVAAFLQLTLNVDDTLDLLPPSRPAFTAANLLQDGQIAAAADVQLNGSDNEKEVAVTDVLNELVQRGHILSVQCETCQNFDAPPHYQVVSFEVLGPKVMAVIESEREKTSTKLHGVKESYIFDQLVRSQSNLAFLRMNHVRLCLDKLAISKCTRLKQLQVQDNGLTSMLTEP